MGMVSDMTDPAKNTNTEIDESGFDMGSSEQEPQGNKKDKSGASPLKKDTPQIKSKRAKPIMGYGAFSNIKKPIAIGASAIILSVVAGSAYWYMSGVKGDSDMLAALQAEQTGKPSAVAEPVPAKPGAFGGTGNEPDSISVAQGPDGVKINGHHDLVATLLLQNYPTREELRQELSRVRGADVSKEELDAFLLSVRNNADEIRRLKASQNAGSNSELTSAINDVKTAIQELRDDTRAQRASIAEMSKRLETLEKNSGWYHNRLSKLEGNPVPTSKKSRTAESVSQGSEVRRVELKSQSAWTVNGASENLAFIQNIHTGKRLRVTRGFDIPGCGQVTDISPANQKVTTTTCVIAN